VTEGRGRVVGWVLLALAGLAVAVALSVAASNLSTQPIGLSGEQLRAGDRLAPAEPAARKSPAKRKPSRTTTAPALTRSTTAPAPTPTPVQPTTTTGSSGSGGGEPGDDHGGSRHSGSDD
jgi:hypothetical protein